MPESTPRTAADCSADLSAHIARSDADTVPINTEHCIRLLAEGLALLSVPAPTPVAQAAAAAAAEPAKSA